MLQTAKVISLTEKGEAILSIKRASACGHDCTSCGACGAQSKPITVTVCNSLNAEVGDTVEIESETSRVLGFAFVVYLVPIILFFALYAVVYTFAKSEGFAILGGGLGFALGLVFTFLLNRFEARKKTISCTMVRVIS